MLIMIIYKHLAYVLLCMYIFTCISGLDVWMHGTCRYFSSGIFSSFVKSGSFIGLESHQRGQPSWSESLQRSTCLPPILLSLGMCFHVELFTWVLGSKLSYSYLWGKSLTAWAIFFDYIKVMFKLLQSSFFMVEHLRSPYLCLDMFTLV